MSDVINKTKLWLEKNNFPCDDRIELNQSESSFDDGSHYGIEMPVINSMEVLELTTKMLEKRGGYCSRFNETKGSFLLTDSEIKDMLSHCKEKNIGIIFSLGPRPEYDRKATFYRTSFGLEQGRQLNNADAMAQAIDEAVRLIELGCRGLILYDLGILKILATMREQKIIPQNVMLKASTHCTVSNPVIAKIYEDIGINSVTLLHDADYSILQYIRNQSNKLVIDLPLDTYHTKGGFIRYPEIPLILKISPPVILKVGAGAQAHPYDPVNIKIIEQRVNRIILVNEIIEKSGLKVKALSNNSTHMCIPEV